MVDRGDHRIGDAERQQAVDVLRAHTGAGRLSLDEFSDLVGKVYAAQTYRELEAVGRDLPPGLVPEAASDAGDVHPVAAGPFPGGVPAIVPPGSAVPVRAGASGVPAGAAPARARRRFVAIMSGARARGRWRAPARVTALGFWGSVHIDMRHAEVEGPVVDVYAWAVMGGVHVTVPPGMAVELDGMVVMGSSVDRTQPGGATAGAARVRVHARGLWGGVDVRTKAPRQPGDDDADRRRPGRDHGHRVHRRHVEPLELTQRVLDDLARALPPIGSRPGAPVPRRSPDPRSPSPAWGPGPWPDRPGRRRGGPTRPGASQNGAAPGGSGGDGAVPSGTLTMMVTDIVDSTPLAEQWGDRRWIEVLAQHNTLVRDGVARHGGTEVKAQGDGFLVVFPSARRAILAAIDVQRALADYRTEHPDVPLDVRIGLHTGEIVDVDGDVLGQNVVVAARIADHAEAGEIVVSALTRDLTASGGDLAFGPSCEVALKGLSTPWRLHRVLWDGAPGAVDATDVAGA